ncbi:hypothetical protein N0V86_002779 [Didymella sp. IMI 355093]|nr:hypothetical protein N0V86_002779 [Didymella sp. IMI 355093]
MSSSSSSQSRKAQSEAFARRKALQTHVYISGLRGVHTLETGLAYYYRGHYMYAYPAGNLVEPTPYSTRKGIMIQGVLDAGAPVYDASAVGLREEKEVRALEASVESEMQRKEKVMDACGLEVDGAQEEMSSNSMKHFSAAPSPALRLTPPAEDLRTSLTSLSVLRDNGTKAFTPRHGVSCLAASAPGSRLASRSASPSGLRPVSSHVALARLGAIKGHNHHKENAGNEANSPAEDISSRPASSVGYLYGLGDHALAVGYLARSVAPERAKPCAIHGEECDGVSVERACLTEETRWELGFVEEVPVISRGDKQMVDWASLLEEARAEKRI